MKCPNPACGKEVYGDASFCTSCGTKLDKKVEPAILSSPGPSPTQNPEVEKRARYRKYGSYMLFIALVCFFAASGIRSDGYRSHRLAALVLEGPVSRRAGTVHRGPSIL